MPTGVSCADIGLTSLYRVPWLGDVLLALGIGLFAFMVYSAVWMAQNGGQEVKKGKAIVLASIFALLPPLYFFVEIFLFRDWGMPCQWDQFKHMQAAAAKIWAAGLLVLYAVYTKNFPK